MCSVPDLDLTPGEGSSKMCRKSDKTCAGTGFPTSLLANY